MYVFTLDLFSSGVFREISHPIVQYEHEGTKFCMEEYLFVVVLAIIIAKCFNHFNCGPLLYLLVDVE